MRSLLVFLLDNSDQILIFAGFSILAIVGVYLIYWASNRNRFIKYLPGLVLLIISLYKLKNGIVELTSYEGLKDIYTFGILFVTGFVSLVYALMLGISRAYKKKYKMVKKDG